MTKIYLIRHGESEANKYEIFTGKQDFPLSKKGYKQAELVGEYLKDKKIEKIYSSDLKRAYDTGLPTAKAYGYEIEIEKGIRELDGGKWEGLTFEELLAKYPSEYPVFVNDFGNASCDGGESIKSMSERVLEAFERIIRKNEGKTIAIFTHACPIRELQCLLCGRPISDMAKIKWVGNASTSLVTYENGIYSFEMIGYNEYLSDLATTLPNKV